MRTPKSIPDTLTIEQVAERLGISRALAYDLAKHNNLPAPVLRLGRRMVVARPALDRVLERVAVEANDSSRNAADGGEAA